jgi:osomolarity two-component system response regulator SKN7
MGHLMPKSAHDDGNGNWSFDPGSLSLGSGLPPAIGGLLPDVGGYDTSGSGPGPAGISRQSGTNGSTGPEAGSSTGPGTGLAAAAATASTASTSVPARPTTAQKLRVRRSTFVPGWAVPPRVLLVDDDEVNRRMSSKFLQVFGCTIDVAVDGVGAVERMNLEKYDLVLMVGFFFFLGSGTRGRDILVLTYNLVVTRIS